MRNLLTVYLGFLAICFIFHHKFSAEISLARHELYESNQQCVAQKDQSECDFKRIFQLIRSHPEYEMKYKDSLVLPSNSGDLINLNTGEIVDATKYFQFIEGVQVKLFLAQQKKDFVESDRNEKNEKIVAIVIFSLRIISLVGLLWLGWKITKTAATMNFTSMMFICGFISLILAPFTGVTVVTAAAFFIIGWVFDTNKN